MLTKEDLQQISQLIYRNVGQIIEEQINPQFDQVWERFDHVDERLDRVEIRMGAVESTMVTKDYLDDKLADLRGDLIIIDRKEDK
jgi:hypothetical protein